jgi:putative acetyltransferase
MTIQNIFIRETGNEDFNDIMTVERRAFKSEGEAQLTAGLLNDESAEPMLSLLAFQNSIAVGHILFTRAIIKEAKEQKLMHILAPLAVIPECQKMGVGGMLIREGLKRLKELGSNVVFVLGHETYYPRHGFIPDANRLGYPAPYPIPEIHKNAWMVQYLTKDKSKLPKGTVICAKAMDREDCWRE